MLQSRSRIYKRDAKLHCRSRVRNVNTNGDIAVGLLVVGASYTVVDLFRDPEQMSFAFPKVTVSVAQMKFVSVVRFGCLRPVLCGVQGVSGSRCLVVLKVNKTVCC